MSQPASSHQRLHDLDALRAAAMLIGIAYHAARSFAVGFPWMVQDAQQDTSAFIFQAWVHGFRMQLFMLISGFFTAMLWRQKGLGALLWHRCRWVLFPCLVGLITVVPAMFWATDLAARMLAKASSKGVSVEPASASLWAAIRQGEPGAVEGHLATNGEYGEDGDAISLLAVSQRLEVCAQRG
jgi:peptidoglycan/LPS O-acetylase OafA/YrhL